MPRLKNPKHERLAKNLLKSKFNQVEAYRSTYNCKDSSAHANASKAMAKYGIVTRAIEIAEGYDDTKLYNLIHSFTDDINASKPIVTKNGVEYTRDNAVILEAKKFLISKVHGVGNETGKGDTFNIDARQVNVTATDSDAMLKLCGRIDTLNTSLKQSRQDRDEAIDI